jgi:hypothetical protein
LCFVGFFSSTKLGQQQHDDHQAHLSADVPHSSRTEVTGFALLLPSLPKTIVTIIIIIKRQRGGGRY